MNKVISHFNYFWFNLKHSSLKFNFPKFTPFYKPYARKSLKLYHVNNPSFILKGVDISTFIPSGFPHPPMIIDSSLI